MNVRGFSSSPAVFSDYSSLPKDQFLYFLDKLIRQMPGFVALKTVDSVYASANILCAKFAGYDTVDDLVGKKDEDWRCDSAILAKVFQKQDKQIVKTQEDLKCFSLIKFSTGWTYYFSTKSMILAPNGEPVGVLFVGNVVTDEAILRTLNLIASDHARLMGNTSKNVVYLLKQTNTFRMTLREEECLFYLLRGKSAKETAKLLGISFRTVEFYIDQIKNKFNCHTKSELFSKAIEAGYLYRIPLSLLKSS